MSKTSSTAFAAALTNLIDRLYDGNRTAFGRDCNIPGPTLYTLCTARVSPSKARLESIADALNKDERQRILLAAAQDVIPGKYQAEVIESSHSLSRSKLTEDLANVIHFLEDEAFSEPETAALLRSIGRWTGIISDDGEQALTYDPYPDSAAEGSG